MAASKVARMADLMVAWMAGQRVSQKVASRALKTAELMAVKKVGY